MRPENCSGRYFFTMSTVTILGKEYSDRNEIKRALKELSHDIGLLNFNTGFQLSQIDAGPSDSLGATILRNIPESIGSGLYTTPDIVDIDEWREKRSEDLGVNKSTFSINVIDLDQYQDGMIRVNNDDESYLMTNFLKDLSSNILASDELKNKVIQFRQNQLNNTNIPKYLRQRISTNELMNKHAEFINLFCPDISKDSLERWTSVQIKTISKLLKNELDGGNTKPSIFNKNGIATDFFKDFCNATGIDNSRTQFSDSTSLGNLIFDVGRVKPLADLGEDISAAYYLFRLCHKNIFERKIKALVTDKSGQDFEQFALTYEACFRGRKSSKEIKKEIKDMYKIQQRKILDSKADDIVNNLFTGTKDNQIAKRRRVLIQN